MPAVSVSDPRTLPVVAPPAPAATRRPVAQVLAARHTVEGAGFEVWRPFPGGVDSHLADPFFLLDEMGPVVHAPGTAVGAPWHPHRGFETVTYLLDGEVAHHDSHGGGGVIGAGDTQWMTAGAGVLHDEVPTPEFQRTGGRMHGVQLWVNLAAADKFVEPRYQAITKDDLTLLTTPAGDVVLRLIAGPLGEHTGPGATYSPIVYAHATVQPGAVLDVPWDPAHRAYAYVLDGRPVVGADARPVEPHTFVVFGDGDAVRVEAGDEPVEILLLGGAPIGQPIAHHGPFLMNTRAEIVQAMEDFQAGRFGAIPQIPAPNVPR